jgi:hypothetical protein
MLSTLLAGEGFFVKLIFFMPLPSVNLGMLRNEHFLPRNNGSCSESIPWIFFGSKFHCQPLYPPTFGAGGGEDTLAGGRGGGGSIVRKTPDTALYSIYVNTLWAGQLTH